MLDTTQHPCFNDAARHQFARIHLPVAPHCNIQCNFCHREYDCANESRPGVTTAVLSPLQAMRYLEAVLEKDPRIAVVGIAGPGDPFATPDTTMETLRLVRRRHPEMLLCVASNGLNVMPYVAELAAIETSHVTITVNAVDPDIGAKIVAWVRDRKRIYRGREGAELLWSRQAAAIRALKERGITVKINTILVPGVNDQHVAEVARRVSELGADIANCLPLYPVAETPFADIASPSPETVKAIRAEVAQFLPIMEHCTRCRADAVGLLGEPMPSDVQWCLLNAAASPAKSAEHRPFVAAATQEGVLVNQHLGEAEQIAVFGRNEEGFYLADTRRAPPSGGGAQRWQALAETLKDCRAFLVASAGDSPRRALADEGINVIMMEGLIEDGLDAVFQGRPVRSPQRTHRCGSGCAGSGMGCS
jgi:nitrogen fixation protein NifB